MGYRIRSACCFMLLMGRLLTIVNGQNRTAKDMTLAYYKEILATAISEEESEVTEDEWRVYAEWDWGRSEFHEVNETKRYPFIVCDDKKEDETIEAMDDRQGYVQVALGYTFDEVVDFGKTLEILPVVNTEDKVCVVGSFYSSKAAEIPFIVQPLSFLMKISVGTADFEKQIEEYDEDSEYQYAIFGCPGYLTIAETYYDEAWWNDAFDQFVPWLDWLIESGVSADKTLLELKPLLDDDPQYCDNLLKRDVTTELTYFNYTTVTLTDKDNTRSRQCFQLFAYAMAAAPEICYIERVIPPRISNADELWIVEADRACETPFQDRGLAGKGEVVAVSDTGVDLKSCYFADANPSDSIYTGVDNTQRKVVSYFPYQDGTDDVKGHGSHVSGTIAGRKSTDGNDNVNGFVDGIARDAKLAVMDIGMTGGGLKVPDMATLLAPGQSAGALIHSASWGSNNKYYNTKEYELDSFTYNTPDDDSFLFIVAAGNSGSMGPKSVASPCKAKNTLCVGATQLDSNFEHTRASFSSYGPTEDGRIKPDVVAPGTDVLSVGAESQVSCDPDTLPSKGRSKYGLASKSGTSMATPVVSGTAAIVHQYFKEGWQEEGLKQSSKGKTISGTLLKAILINGARSIKGYGLNEVNFEQGFGIVNLSYSLPLSGENDMTADFSDHEILKRTGDTNIYEFNDICKSGSTYEFSVTLVWADYPGQGRGQKLLMNDLDLTVTQKSMSGETKVHYPNGKNEKDSMNTVERIRFIASNQDSITYQVKAAKLLSLGRETEGKYSIVATSRCNDFQATAEFKTSSVCYTLYDDGSNKDTSQSYRIQHGWGGLLTFILITMGMLQAFIG